MGEYVSPTLENSVGVSAQWPSFVPGPKQHQMWPSSWSTVAMSSGTVSRRFPSIVCTAIVREVTRPPLECCVSAEVPFVPSSSTSMSPSVRSATCPRPAVAVAHALSLIEGVESEIQWHEDADLRGFDAAIVPGGFSYGDYLRAGAIAKLSPGTKELRRFAAEGGAILGSCNGFQILCEAGLLPGALIRNADLAYRSDRVRSRVENEETPFTRGLRGAVLRMPIGNGEGCWVADPETHARVEAASRVIFRYVDERGVVTADANPNGSLANIAGVANETGNVVGLMPHPERCVEALLGGTDGYRMLANLAGARHGTAPALYR